jgi:HK97 family phage major capsid protein
MRVGEESARANGIEARGLYIPADMLMRTMSVTDTGFGGNTVATNIASGSFIDILRNKSVVMALATKLDGLVGNVQIPRQSGASTVYKPAEKVAITQSDVATDFITLSPTRYGASVPVTKQLLMQSSLAVENMIRNDIAAQIALAIESDVITAILAGATTVALGTNGAVPTWQNFIDLETAVTSANADMGRLAYLINAKGRGKLKSTPKVAGYPDYIIDKDGSINGYEQMMTNIVSSVLTKGTGTNLSAAIFGNFDDVLIGTWGGLDIIMDVYTQAKEGIINITADQFADYDLRHTTSFAAIKDMVTV